ncbi:MocR-like pyridoxine biosynthesis transcription factor PdxR [Aquibacillus rhizosphaerae]|uniref:PLP-dependent aminotransferase family protein n=1 Tax=Aquibacillus rhizosphaerae TaxID=3051431 RepID=A0ABT7L2N0_9BACI|nr:PLP-dependent aminotransferase family protein [Aquibacillus sp. LR5S19]MDL4839435.1 PLP-dependent aminotransferase family protein [Aquibacillus sp. LR5S19]
MIWIELNKTSEKPIYQQIYVRVKEQILLGELAEGERLPSSRVLATTLNVSRSVILEAYDQLIAEGYIKSKQGAGTFVESGISLEGFPSGVLPPVSVKTIDSKNNPKSIKNNLIDFRSGVPCLKKFPRKKWGSIGKDVYENIEASLFGYSSPEGSEQLRNVLSTYLDRTRGINCHPNQIIITSGATQAFTLLAKLLVKSNSEVLIEDPVTKEIPEIFIERGAKITPISVDEFGMQTERLTTKRKACIIFVTPSHQFPLGGILPIQRRIQLINFAKKTNSYIIEDDYDSEFRYSGHPVSSIQGLCPERVIYIGTFSKILSPSLRIGYLILPNSLVEEVKNLKRYTDYHSPTIEQVILARFIKDGHLEKHIVKMRKLYNKKRAFLIKCLKNEFGDLVTILGASTGIHLVGQFNIKFSTKILDEIKLNGVNIFPVENHALVKGHHNNKLIFGYGNLTEEELEQGIKRLRNVIEAEIAKKY